MKNVKQRKQASESVQEIRGIAELERELRRELLGLDFSGFERTVGDLLRSMGYGSVRIRRDHMEGRNRDGGWDIEATFPAGLAELRTIIQVKQYGDTPVQKRYVDELRGSMLRAKADHGLIVTLSAFSNTATAAAEAGAIAPVRLIDGGELVRLMIARCVGVTKDDNGVCNVDRTYFEHHHTPDKPNRTFGRHTADTAAAATSVTVVVVTGSERRHRSRKERR